MDVMMFDESREMPIVLASASPRRADILRMLGIPFEVVVSGSDEQVAGDLTPEEAAIETACGKADIIAEMTGTSKPILACDTMVVLDGEIFGKPTGPVDAARMLRRLSGRTHEVISGVCLRHGTETRTFAETTEVSFYELSDRTIERYVATEEPLDKAGAYGIQGRGLLLVRGIAGDYYNVVGLPAARTVRELALLTGDRRWETTI